MSKSLTLLAVAGAIVVGGTAYGVLARDSSPLLRSEAAVSTGAGPAANREGKTDKLPRMAVALTTAEPDRVVAAALTEPLRASTGGAFEPVKADAFATVSPAQPAKATATTALAGLEPKARVAPPKPAVQKTYALLSDAQIASIKTRLNLSASQEAYWPGVEASLRAIARKLHAVKQGNPAAGAASIDPDSDEVQQLKSAALPLLFQLREDQKQEVRSLARLIGLHAVAAQI